MKTLFELAYQLKNDLLKAENVNFTKQSLWIKQEEIHALRKGVKNIPADILDMKSLHFLNSCIDFRSIYNYFYHSYEAEYNDHYIANEEISRCLDPLCIYLMDNDYEISIRRISLSHGTNTLHQELLLKIEEMEDACQKENFDRVTTLSSSILQSIFKVICDNEDIEYENNEKFPSLFKKIKKTLHIDPKDKSKNENIKKLCSKLSVLIITINEIRNLYSDSHGLETKSLLEYRSIPKHHYKLIVDSTKTSINFLMSSYLHQYGEKEVEI